MGPYNAGPISVLFLRVALIKAGVRTGVIMAILKREYQVETLSFFEIWYIASLACTLSFYTNFLTNTPIKSGKKR